MVTWRNLTDVIWGFVENERSKPEGERDMQLIGSCFNQMNLLNKYFDISYSLRNPPTSQ